MKKAVRNTLCLCGSAIGFLYLSNKAVKKLAGRESALPEKGGRYYNWKHEQIYYKQSGTGTPVLLIHDLDPAGSAYEWHKIVRRLSQNHTVYALDLLGCGRSDKPEITYTNYLYVQLLNDFTREVIEGKPDVIASGLSFSLAVMASQMEPELYNKLVGVNPPDLYELRKTPNGKRNLLKFLLELPQIGTFTYNLAVSKRNIINKITNEGYYRSDLADPRLIRACYQAAHKQNGKYLYASIKSCYVNIDISRSLKKTEKNIFLICGSRRPFAREDMSEYKKLNPAIRIKYIPDTAGYPHLEKPAKFISVLDRIL